MTIECKVNYLASIPIGPVTAEASVLSVTGHIAVVEARLHRSDGKLAAIGLATFMITHPGAARPERQQSGSY